jgi:hypothetical protein
MITFHLFYAGLDIIKVVLNSRQQRLHVILRRRRWWLDLGVRASLRLMLTRRVVRKEGAPTVVWTSLGPLPRWVPGPTTRWAPGTTRLALHGT